MNDSLKYLMSKIDSCPIEEIAILILNRAIKYSKDFIKYIGENNVHERYNAIMKVSDLLSFLLININSEKLPSLCEIIKICFRKLIYMEKNKDIDQAESLIQTLKMIKQMFADKLKNP